MPLKLEAKMKKEIISDFDVSEYLENENMIAEYLNAVMEEDDSNLLLAAIGDIAKARGMAKIASESGLGRESLYKALKPNAKPRFDTIIKVMHAIGVDLSITPQRLIKKKTRAKHTAPKPVH